MPASEPLPRPPRPIRVLVTRIETRMGHLDTNAAAVSRRAGLGPTAVHDILSGKNRNPSALSVRALAKALDCQYGYLFGEQDTPNAPIPTSEIPIIGIVEAGAFRPMPDFGSDSDTAPPSLNAPRSRRYPHAKAFALEVWGDSMNAAKPVAILQGMYVLCVDMVDARLSIESGKIYVMRQTKDGGQTYELTVKRARVFADRIELVPESTSPRHRPIVVPLDFDTESHKEIAAIGWVYGTYTSLED